MLLSGTTIFTPMAANSKLEQKIISVPISDIQIELEDSLATLTIPESQTFTNQPGKPKLPTIEKTVFLPVNVDIKDIHCSIDEITSETIDRNIRLSSFPVQLGQEKPVSKRQSSFYQNPQTFPNKWMQYDIGRGLNKGEPAVIVKLQINPVQYYPQQHMIKKAEKIEINIEYQTQTIDVFTQTEGKEEYDLIILSPTEFIDNLQPLVDHKQNRNISTKLVSLEDIYYGTYFPVEGIDDAEKIKHFIKNAYDSWKTNFVLLVGSADLFPTRDVHVYIGYHDDGEILVSDLYYADLYDENNTFQNWDTNNNGIYAEYNWSQTEDNSSGQYDTLDLYPDVYLGRLACVNDNEADIVVDKIIQYELSQAYLSSWFKNIVLIGGDSFPAKFDEHSGINEGELANQHVLDVMDGFIGTKLWASNMKLAGSNPSGVKRIMDSIGEGCGFVHFSGHGSSTVWTTYPHNGTKQSLPTPFGSYRADHIDDLSNGYKLPVVVTGACSVGKFQISDDCFSWGFVSSPEGGAIASFGATGLGYACLGPNVTDAVVEKMALEMFKAYKIHEARTVGEMWATAITNYITPVLYDSDYKTIEEWQPFCDPSLALRTEYLTPSQPPNTPNIEGPSTGKTGISYVFNATTADPDRDDIFYLFDWGDGSFSEWLGPVGSGVTVSKDHRWEEKTTYSLRVKARDEYYHESNWSEPITISLPKHKSFDFPFLRLISEYLNWFLPEPDLFFLD